MLQPLLVLVLACTGASTEPTDPVEPTDAELQEMPSTEEILGGEALQDPGDDAVAEVVDPEPAAPGEPDPAPDAPSEPDAPAEPAEPASDPTPDAPATDPSDPGHADPVDQVAPDPDPGPEVPVEPARGATDYTLGPKGSSLYVRVYKDTSTAASDLSHNHVMLATGWTGSATWDPTDVGACALSVEVPVKKLSVDPPKLRAALKMEGELSESQRADVKKNMLSKSQLDAANHPTVTFTATQCVAKGDQVLVTGDLTLHGVTNTVSLPMTVTEDGQSFEARGTLKIKATDYGIEPFSAMLGALKNKNQMTLSIRLAGTN